MSSREFSGGGWAWPVVVSEWVEVMVVVGERGAEWVELVDMDSFFRFIYPCIAVLLVKCAEAVSKVVGKKMVGSELWIAGLSQKGNIDFGTAFLFMSRVSN